MNITKKLIQEIIKLNINNVTLQDIDILREYIFIGLKQKNYKNKLLFKAIKKYNQVNNI